MTTSMETEELNLSAGQVGSTRLERLRKNLTRYVEKWTPLPAELIEVCLAVDDQDEEWMTRVVDQTYTDLKKGVEGAVEDFLKKEIESTDLQGNLEEIDDLEADSKDKTDKEAWRPSRVIADDVQVFRMNEKQMHLLELQKELSAREDAVDEALGRLRQLEDRVSNARKEAETEMTQTEDRVAKIGDIVAAAAR